MPRLPGQRLDSKHDGKKAALATGAGAVAGAATSAGIGGMGLTIGGTDVLQEFPGDDGNCRADVCEICTYAGAGQRLRGLIPSILLRAHFERGEHNNIFVLLGGLRLRCGLGIQSLANGRGRECQDAYLISRFHSLGLLRSVSSSPAFDLPWQQRRVNTGRRCAPPTSGGVGTGATV